MAFFDGSTKYFFSVDEKMYHAILTSSLSVLPRIWLYGEKGVALGCLKLVFSGYFEQVELMHFPKWFTTNVMPLN